MDPMHAGIVAATFFFAAFVKGTTGLGFSTTCLPFLVIAVGLKETLPLLIVPSIASNLLVMHDAGRFREAAIRFWPIFLSVLPGVALGLFLLGTVDVDIAAAVLGTVLIAYCLLAYRHPNMHLPARWERPLATPTGLANGIINGLTGSQVMPILPYMLALRLDPNLFVQATNCAFTLSSIAMAAGLSKIGLMSGSHVLLSAAGLVPVYLGVKAGNRARRWLSPQQFRNAVLAVLLLLGGTLEHVVRDVIQDSPLRANVIL